MDPEVALQEMREAVARIEAGCSLADAMDALGEIEERAAALQDWVSHGGSMPKAERVSVTDAKQIRT